LDWAIFHPVVRKRVVVHGCLVEWIKEIWQTSWTKRKKWGLLCSFSDKFPTQFPSNLSVTSMMTAFLIIGVAGQRVRTELLVNIDWLSRRLNLVDSIILHIGPCREGDEKGQIPGTRFAPLPELATTRQEIPNELPPSQALHDLFTRLGVVNHARILLYATRAYFTLDYPGHGDRASLLDGGFKQWTAQGCPTQTESPSYSPSPVTASPRSELIVSLDRIRDLSWVAGQEPPSSTFLIDTRPDPQFLGSDAP
jgi:thiosulfate/3-mercaptopyruvate sulfurtransferase